MSAVYRAALSVIESELRIIVLAFFLMGERSSWLVITHL